MPTIIKYIDYHLSNKGADKSECSYKSTYLIFLLNLLFLQAIICTPHNCETCSHFGSIGKEVKILVVFIMREDEWISLIVRVEIKWVDKTEYTSIEWSSNHIASEVSCRVFYRVYSLSYVHLYVYNYAKKMSKQPGKYKNKSVRILLLVKVDWCWSCKCSWICLLP